jgi:hypothetical protein
MDDAKRKRLEAAGYVVGDYGDLLGHTDAEWKMIEYKLALRRAVRDLRDARGISQAQLAKRMGTGQARIAKIEGTSEEVGIDLMLRAFFELGGNPADLAIPERVRARGGNAPEAWTPEAVVGIPPEMKTRKGTKANSSGVKVGR